MKVFYYKSESLAQIQAKLISSILGIYISVEHCDKGYYLSAKYAQGLRASN